MLKLNDNQVTALLFVVLIGIFSLLIVVVSGLSPKPIISESVNTKTDIKSEYLDEARSKIDSLSLVSIQAEQVGSKLIFSGISLQELRTAIQELKDQLESDKLQVEKMKVPPDFVDSHQYLVSAEENMIEYLEYLYLTFEKFEEINDGQIPLYLIYSILGADDTSLEAYHKLLLLGQSDQLTLKESRVLFDSAVQKASNAENEITIYMEKTGIQAYNEFSNSVQSYARLPGRCLACEIPIDQLISYSREG